MKSNTMLTYLLYALLAALILSAGYKACQMQKEKKLKAQEDAEFQETLKKLYPETDTAGGGSTFVNRDSTGLASGTKPSVSASGIEDEPAKSTTTAQKPATTAPSTTTTTPPKTTTKGGTAVQGIGSGKWEVRAGTFSQMDNARDQLEQIIRMGFTNAEIRKTANGRAAVIVLRTNDKNRAIQVVDQLEKRGVDAAVFAR